MTVLLEHLPFETETVIGARARLGLVSLATDYTIEHEYRQVLAHLPGVALYTARIANAVTVTPETLADMEQRLTPTAATLLPEDRVDVVAYGCTSASCVIGADRVATAIRKAKPDVAVTDPITAAMAAFRALGARRIGVLTPYTADVNAQVQATIESGGFEVPVFASFNEPRDPVVAAISEASLESALARVAEAGEIDMLFCSCTSIRLLDAIARLESTLGLPVASSNSAMIWHSLRLAGVEDRLDGLGALFHRLPV